MEDAAEAVDKLHSQPARARAITSSNISRQIQIAVMHFTRYGTFPPGSPKEAQMHKALLALSGFDGTSIVAKLAEISTEQERLHEWLMDIEKRMRAGMSMHGASTSANDEASTPPSARSGTFIHISNLSETRPTRRQR